MRSVSGIGRIAALGAVIAGAVLVALVLFGVGGGGYHVKARFLNAAQLVKGNLVQVGGVRAGSVKDIDVTQDGQAVVTLGVNDKYAPLKRGTKAVVRQASQSGIANRYVELVPPSGKAGERADIPDGGTIPADATTTQVDLDELFNTLDPPTRKALQDFFKGSAAQFARRGDQANRGFRYLNPALSTSSRLFNELNRDTPLLERFLVDSAKLTTAVADRRDDLAALIGNLNQTTRAIGNRKVELADAIGRLPDFMRRANTTFVNLRATLNDVDPLVNASKPVAKQLRTFLPLAADFARNAKPTVRDLSATVRKRGRDNDLVDLTKTFEPLAQIALDTKTRTHDAGSNPVNVGETRGAFPETAQALKDTAPIIAFGRPYTVDLFGWFDDFSTPGGYDALGGYSRSVTYFNAFTFQNTTTPCPSSLQIVGGGCQLVGPLLGARGPDFLNLARTEQYRRCPGGAETPAADGSNVLSEAEQKELDCKDADRETGP
jgi:phospholipid/cholesterol/gamma-HCH transport system substrate-binding protein